MAKRAAKPKRVVLGEGHPWFSGKSGYTNVQLTKEPVASSILMRGGEQLVELRFKNIGNWNRVRLVLEVLDD